MSYGNRRWQKTSRRYLTLHPNCENCGNRANQVHHLDGLGYNGPRGYDQNNLQALCQPCHSRITASRAPRKRDAEEHPGLLGE